MKSSVSGIYSISSPSGRRYIGSAKNIGKRKREHFTALARDAHPNRSLTRAFKKYRGQLTFSILLICREIDLFFYEQRMLDRLCPEYNLSPCATGTRGMKWSDESKSRIIGGRSRDGGVISAAMLASSTSEERSERARHARSCWTADSKARQISKLTGRVDSEETRERKISKLRGRPVSEETKAKLARQAGWKHTEEAKAKMRATRAKNRSINSVDHEVITS